MAEIEIEKKKPIWPWIILVLVILALLYFLVFDQEEEEVLEGEPIEEVEDEPLMEEDAQTTTWEDQTSEQFASASDEGNEEIYLNKNSLSS